jgi:hypothetical protein
MAEPPFYELTAKGGAHLGEGRDDQYRRSVRGPSGRIWSLPRHSYLRRLFRGLLRICVRLDDPQIFDGYKLAMAALITILKKERPLALCGCMVLSGPLKPHLGPSGVHPLRSPFGSPFRFPFSVRAFGPLSGTSLWRTPL